MTKWYLLTGWLNLKQLLLRGDLSLIKIAVSLASFMWSVMLFAPGSTFERQTYSVMLDTMPEVQWAWLFLLHGAISMWAVVWQRTDAWLVIADNVLGSLLWTGSCSMIIIAFAPTDPLPAATGANIVLAAFSWWCLVRNNYGRRT
jgi:hypothetical protein